MEIINITSRIALGTVQFGLNYGVANQVGQVPYDEAHSIVETARINGVRTLDTAIAYGTSEQVLGQIGICDFDVVSKLPAVPADCSNLSAWVLDQVKSSLTRLGVPRLHGLLLHRPEQLLGPYGPELYQAVQTLKELGLVSKIGVSIYNPDDLDSLFMDMSFDLVQAPFNLLDRRLITSGWLERLQSLGVELHVRSVFLQGLLLMPLDRRHHYFDRWTDLWRFYDDWLRLKKVSAVQACLQYALSFEGIDRVVVGVDSCSHLLDIVASTAGDLCDVPDELGCSDVDLLNPVRWRLE